MYTLVESYEHLKTYTCGSVIYSTFAGFKSPHIYCFSIHKSWMRTYRIKSCESCDGLACVSEYLTGWIKYWVDLLKFT